ncbi:MAG: choice-of-anchor D domain-containing protein [Methyloglobulus sp.]|nr:choice-of-anchor D domain-containing protein [Methyloglobulus sp.]
MNYRLSKAIQQILLAGGSAVFAASTLAAVGQQNPPPGPGQIPDYFGVVPNYATSPQPLLTKVTVNTGVQVAAGSGASAAANLGAGGIITGFNNLVGGSGYVTPKVTITDQGLGNGASLAVTTTATVGGVLSVVNFVNGGSDCALSDTVDITAGAGTGATASVQSVDPDTGAVTAINIDNGGAGYTGGASFTVNCSGATAQNATGTFDATAGTSGVISTVDVTQVGQQYSPNAKVVFNDPSPTPGTGAIASVIVDANGAITEINVTNPGTGYSAATTADVIDVGTGTGATASATSKKVGATTGVITAIKVTAAGTGYRNPLIEITDANAGAAGQGAVLVATTYDYATDVMTDKVMDIQVLNAGSGYDAGTVVNITGGAGVVPITVTPLIENGSIVGIEGLNITDPNDATKLIRDPLFAGFGSGFKTPIAGSGIRKFVDALPGFAGVSSYVSGSDYAAGKNQLGQTLPIAVPDTITFPGSDYYEIEETSYTQKLHSDLPPTPLRGYRQLNVDTNAHPEHLGNQYLGPIIVAQKDRPVRVKLVNHLSTGVAGKLPIPVDTTYMGADGANDTDNRTALHLHGGNTPWISDGTARQWVKPAGEVGANKGESARDVPDMWFDASGNLINDPNCVQGSTTCTVPGATNNPGDGALTFFYTNEQSARLMFYHDHTEGTTRLNVYSGLAGGYVLQDPTEQAMISGGTAHDAAQAMGYTPAELAKYDNAHSYTAGTLPPIEDTIPLIIQEKTFMPDNTAPVLNFYGPFSSALNSQDPTWRWGTGTPATAQMGNGDLWVPHVFMPNQNPGDISGANAVGRWDYGAWFWPPFANLQNGPIANPYFNPACNTTTEYCEGPEIPGVPNGSLQAVLSNGVAGGVHDATRGGAITESPSATPEAFNDTPLVNGTAYPYINVDPKKYRLRILSVGNDRMLNLSLVVAASKNADSTALGNSGPVATAPAQLCNGSTGSPAAADCTEVKMVPFDATQNKAANTPFPPHWYTTQKGGVTFDGRPSGVFDPNTRGPAMVQIGTEGGFLSTPVVIKNQPVNYEYNPKNILIGNIKEHALLLGPAERADVLVDFSKFAGSTVILYNDAGAPVPAWDLRLDYYTGNYDNTDTGGAFSVIPGYGPNSRTLMQFRVSTNGGTSTHPVDDVSGFNLAALTTAVQTAFKTSQEPIIVPQSAYNAVYNIAATDSIGTDLSSIFSTNLKFKPLSLPDLNGDRTLLPGSVNLELEPKTIIEDWTMNWGRMNALLGTEVPHTTAINQTSIPQAFVDPPTDLVKITPNDNMIPVTGTLPDGTQLWKVTHNGVDSHSIHFHLFHVQLVNRVGWDGAIYPPEANELGWKDSVLMHPLSDVIVAMRPMVMKDLPFKVPNSHRLLDPAKPVGAPSEFFNFNPLNGNASTVTNQEVNYGWEYLWHCHILGHEENDMMRSIAVAQPPEASTLVSAATKVANGIQLDWTDNSIISNWVTIQRSLDSGFNTGLTTFEVVEPECANQAGCARTYTDTTVPAATSVYYRIMANNTVGAGDGKLDTPRNADGSYGATLPAALSSLTPGFAGYANVTANSVWSGTASWVAVPTASVTAGPLAFGDLLLNTTSAAQTVTVKNTGTGNLAISGAALTTGTNYAITSNTCPVSPAVLAPNATCDINVTFKPTATGALADTLTITDNSSTGPTQTVTLNGNGTAPVAGVTGALTFGNQNIGTTSAAQAVTLSNTGTAPLTIASIVAPAQFAQTNNCGLSLAAGTTCTINVTFTPAAAGAANGNLVITDNSNGVSGVQQTVALSGTGVSPVVLNTPTNLKATVTGTNVALTWGDASTGETGYVVQRAPVTISAAGVQTTGAFATITTPSGNLAANAVSVTNTGVTAGLYTYHVYAVNGATNGAFATVYAYTGTAMATPAQPAASAAGNRTTNSINVVWTVSTPATNAITGYVVQRCNSGVTYGNILTGTTSPNAIAQGAAGLACAAGTWTTINTTTTGSAGVSFNNTGLAGKTLYGYRIAAINTLTGVTTANSTARILWTN